MGPTKCFTSIVDQPSSRSSQSLDLDCTLHLHMYAMSLMITTFTDDHATINTYARTHTHTDNSVYHRLDPFTTVYVLLYIYCALYY